MTTATHKTDKLYATDRTAKQAWHQTFSNALIITRREVRDSFRDWRIIVPIVILTFFFPFLAQWVAARFSGFLASYGAELIGERTIPFLLMIVGFFPISISLVIALETFVGEKERRSLEPLLSTPLTNTELYIGKTLSAMIPPLIASFGGMIVYLSTLLFSELAWRPPAMLVVQIFLLTIVQALVMVTGSVVVSSQTTSTRAANLLASFIILPMTMLVNAESVIMFLAPDAESLSGIGALWAIIGGMIVVVVLLLRLGNSIFNREELLGRTIDSLNLFGVLKKIWCYIRAMDDEGTPAANLMAWYTQAIPHTLKKLKTPVFITIGVFVAYFVLGMFVGTLPQYQLPLGPGQELGNLPTGGFIGLTESEAFGFIVWQNGRVLLLAAFLSMFSFGVASYVLIPTVFVVLGYMTSQLVPVGFGDILAAAILPHGIVEIPVIILATATMFRLGSIITRPPKNQTVGHAWITAFADTVKMAVGVILPGLLLAAFLEAFVTVPIVQQVMGA